MSLKFQLYCIPEIKLQAEFGETAKVEWIAMVCETCAFETNRLLVEEWHSLSRDDNELARVVSSILTGPVTRSLPTSWQGIYTVERARAWIEERDSEGTTLLVVEKSTGQAIGLMILFETSADSISDSMEVRIGYLLSEPSWGQGYATELVRGFVGWCREHTKIRSLVGGVEQGNFASARVLEKNGFQAVQDAEEGPHEQIFRLTLRS